MQLPVFLDRILQFAMVIPGAVLCYLPMRNQLKYSPRRTFVLCVVLFAVILPVAAAFDLKFGESLDPNAILIACLILFFFLYKYTLKTDLLKTLTIFLNGCALMSFPSCFSFAFDAWLHPYSDYYHFSSAANLFQQLLSVGIAVLAAPIFVRKLRKIVDTVDFPQIWCGFLVLPVFFTVFNVFTIPHQYETLHTNRMFQIYLVFEIAMLVMFLFVLFILYYICTMLLEHAQLEERSRFLEIQASQYRALKDHMEQTRRLRHDFRHSLQTLKGLSESNNLPGIQKFLHEYEASELPSTQKNYCKNNALNALFNYYGEMAKNAGIRTDWRLFFPDELHIPEPEICSLLGNLLENAILGCQTANAGQRYFSLKAETKPTGDLYIVSTNSFDGAVKTQHGHYQSTRYTGSGIGLASIEATALRYGGTARFHHEGKEFFADVVLKLK